MKSKTYLMAILLALTSCKSDNNIENIFLNNADEYWKYYTTNSNSSTYFQFNEDHLSHRFEIDNKNHFHENKGEGDIVEVPQKWSVTEDSIMSWGNLTYDIVSFNKKVIVLNYLSEEKPFTGFIFLIKTNENEIMRGPGFFEQKRIKDLEKYNFKND
ncbi:hypothetical protein [Flavobacterium branchiicola]|uniref:Uncharacterized protein n=1 Tax=Flavobacterium branchiicola TaxID=1114875 RepID=A0ABV9PF46_9FLAO|nr:hypothetical protein [Flavobacterium branchiicola]MBS7254256.1 hypothetical protein [Flavobacterium branchiicola]